jgi:hypothetical protein
MKMVTVRNIALFASLISFSNSVLADFTFNFPPPLTISTNYISTSGISDSLAEERRARQFTKHNKSTYSPTRPLVAPINLAFTPNMQRRRAQLNTLAEQIGRANPGRTEEFRSLFLGNGSGDIIQQMQSEVSRYGLKTNNLAHAYALLWVDCWKMSQGDIESQLDTGQIKSVVAVAELALGSSPAIRNLNMTDKQALTDAMWIQLFVLSSAAEGVKTNMTTMSDFQKGVRQVAKTFNVDIDNFTLTPNGFVNAAAKKRSDATEALPGGQQSGADGTQMASASATKGDTDEGTGSGLLPGVLIAGLAGSTLAAAFLYGKNKGAKKGNG